MEAKSRKAVSGILIVILLAGLSGCNEENHSDRGKPLRLSPIYQSAITGAIVGGIIGYQSEEEGEGAALGAAIFGVGALLGEIDRANKEGECEDENDDEQEVVFQIRNGNGSQTAVVLKKSGGTYIGPEGERYDRLPAAEQLRQKYGS